MTTETQRLSSHLCAITPASLLTVAAICAGLPLATKPAGAQTYTVLYAFSSQQSVQPAAGLAIDRGALYGTTTYSYGGGGDGQAFKMKQRGSNWIFLSLFKFPIDGNRDPRSPLLIAPDGTLFGTLYYNLRCES